MNTKNFSEALHNAKCKAIYSQFEDKVVAPQTTLEKAIDSDNIMDVMRNQNKYSKFAVASHFKKEAPEGISLTEEVFEKAVTDMGLEVYTSNDLNGFKSNVMRAGVNGKLTSANIEKAKRDVAALTKVNVSDKNGKIRSVWVRKSEGKA